MKILLNLDYLGQRQARTDCDPIPYSEYIDSLPPVAERVQQQRQSKEDIPGGSWLAAAETWMLPHLMPGMNDPGTGGHRNPGREGDRGRRPMDEVDEAGELEPEDEAARMAVDVYGELAAARALCHFPDLYPTFRVIPLGGEDTNRRYGVSYDAYRGYSGQH